MSSILDNIWVTFFKPDTSVRISSKVLIFCLITIYKVAGAIIGLTAGSFCNLLGSNDNSVTIPFQGVLSLW